MSRLIAFGCSLTFGHGLPDCYVPPTGPGNKPSQFVWPNVIADVMNKRCINLSSPGCSNKRIWNNIVNFKFKDDDVVFILWSYPERSAIISSRDSIKDIGSWGLGTDKSTDMFYEMFPDYDIELQSKLFISHANFFLNNLNITVYNLLTDRKFLKLLNLNGTLVPSVPVFLNDYRYKYPQALDNRHPGIECNIEFAKGILSYLGIPNYIPKQKKISFLERIKLKCKN